MLKFSILSLIFFFSYISFSKENTPSRNTTADCTISGTSTPTTTVDYFPGAKIGNSFTACSSGYITSISFYMDTDGVNGGNKNTGTHNVRLGAGNNPMTLSLANALSSAGTISTVNGAGGKVTLSLDNPMSVTAGSVYAVVIDIAGTGLFSMDRGENDMTGGDYFEVASGGTFNSYPFDLSFEIEISTLPTIGFIGQVSVSTVLNDSQANQVLVLGTNNVIKKKNISSLISNDLPTTPQSAVQNDTQAGQVLVLDQDNIIKKRDISSLAPNELPASPQSGDMVYYNGTAWVRIPAGQQGQTLTFCGGVPTWGSCTTPPCTLSSLNTVNAGMSYWPPPTMNISVGNTFTACKTGQLTSISIKMHGGSFQPNQNAGTHTIKFGAGAIPMNPTAFNALTTVGTITTVAGGGTYTLTLANPVNVVQGNVYAFSLTIAGTGIFTIAIDSGQSSVPGGGFFVYDPDNTFTNWGPTEDLGYSVMIN